MPSSIRRTRSGVGGNDGQTVGQTLLERKLEGIDRAAQLDAPGVERAAGRSRLEPLRNPRLHGARPTARPQLGKARPVGHVGVEPRGVRSVGEEPPPVCHGEALEAARLLAARPEDDNGRDGLDPGREGDAELGVVEHGHGQAVRGAQLRATVLVLGDDPHVHPLPVPGVGRLDRGQAELARRTLPVQEAQQSGAFARKRAALALAVTK